MNPGPLRRLSGSLGLIALAPTAWLLSTEAITLTEAAWRAAATLVIVVALGRLIGWVLGGLAGSFERESEDGVEFVPAGGAGADAADKAHATDEAEVSPAAGGRAPAGG